MSLMHMMRPILVVEDDQDCRIMLATLLTSAGFQVLTASNGAEGLTVARRHHPCLILLDYMMPIMDGAEFRLEQRADPSLADIPVVLLSARHEAEELKRRLDVVDVVQKPIMVEPLLKTVREHCSAETTAHKIMSRVPS
jgi:CheY-like chemotaxis protein